MPPPRAQVLAAFTNDERTRAHRLLAGCVATMMGRKLEEGDWTNVYCRAKGIPVAGWSNLNIDVIQGTLGVEHKMLCTRSSQSIAELCGTTRMHPAATRSIRIPSVDDATAAARGVLQQYADLILQRRRKIEETSGGKADLRTGWLLWQESLREFLYFEEEMLAPNPSDYRAEWRESGGGARKASRNLWVYENDTGRKRYSITTAAGAKIQPYFDVPPPDHPNVYIFVAQGERLSTGLVRLWITEFTARALEQALGSLDSKRISDAILEAVANGAKVEEIEAELSGEVREITLEPSAYEALYTAFEGVADEHRMQLFLRHIKHR